MKIDFECKDEYVGEEEMLAYLILKGPVFINNGWYNKDWPTDHTTLHVTCNDTFGYAVADAENLLYSEIESLYNCIKANPELGAIAWCVAKRKELPIPEIISSLKSRGYDVDKLLEGIVE